MPVTKPTNLADWATDANYSSGAYVGTPTKVNPSAGEFEQGHGPGAKTAAQKQNTWQSRVGLWIAYLNDLVTNTFALDPNVSFQVSGTGKYKRGELVRHYVPAGGRASGGTFPQSGLGSLQYQGSWVPAAANNVLLVPLFGLQDGERIKKVEIGVIGNSVAVFDCGLYYNEGTAFGWLGNNVGSASSTAALSAAEKVTIAALTHAVGDAGGTTGNRSYYMSIRVNGAIAGDPTPMQVGAICVTTDVP